MFETNNLAKECNSEKLLNKKHGAKMARTIQKRLKFLASSSTLADVPHTPPFRLHKLQAKKEVHLYAVDLIHPDRLVFRPNHDPLPLKDDGGIDVKKVTSIIIVGIGDYH